MMIKLSESSSGSGISTDPLWSCVPSLNRGERSDLKTGDAMDRMAEETRMPVLLVVSTRNLMGALWKVMSNWTYCFPCSPAMRRTSPSTAMSRISMIASNDLGDPCFCCDTMSMLEIGCFVGIGVELTRERPKEEEFGAGLSTLPLRLENSLPEITSIYVLMLPK